MKDKRQNNHPASLADYGKVPPQAIDAEESVLGICLVYPDSISELRLMPEMFYKDAHQKIFASILEVANNGLCDLVTVTDDLRKKNQLEAVGGPLAMTQLTSKVFTDQMIQAHTLLVKQTYIAREYIRIGQELVNKGFTDDIADIAEFAETSLFQLSDFTQVKEPRHISHSIDEVLKEVEMIYNKKKSLIGIPSGYTSVDRITGGWQPGNLIIVAGRPSMGKTALALALAKNPAILGYPIGMFSLEMSDMELATRYLSGSSGYTNTQIRNARLDLSKLCADSHETANIPIYIDDTSAISLLELRSKVKKLILKHGVKLIIVDYLQLMSAEAGSREQEVSKISRGLKSIAKEFNIPVIALSQLNRGVEDRADRKPRLSDLRESGAIEQDADIVCFVYRPAYYGLESMVIDNIVTPSFGLLCVYCEKNRNGALFSVGLEHNSSMTNITDREPNFK
jgi:replicative DNA helicase